MRKSKSVAAVGAVLALAATLAVAPGAGATTRPSASGGTTVGTTAAPFTPWLSQTVSGQKVRQLRQCNTRMYAVGHLSAIQQGSSSYTRGNAFSFSATTGAVSSFDPKLNGTVNSIALSPDCRTAYLGGNFTKAGSAVVSNFAAVSTTTGALVRGYRRNANAAVSTVQYTHGNVLVGGLFTKINDVKRSKLASLNPRTGAVTAWANLGVKGGYAHSPVSKIYNSQVNHAQTKMLVQGIFTSIGGRSRQQVAILDLTSPRIKTDLWYAPEFKGSCSASKNFYAKGGAWSPDDRTVYIATTGYKPTTPQPGSDVNDPRAGTCDAALSFPAAPTRAVHTWVNYTGCDSLYAVAADANNVYVGGHIRYLDNPNHCDGPGAGAVERRSIGNIDPATGLATDWNPGKQRAHGVEDMLLTADGLWIASDNGGEKVGYSQECAGSDNKGGICFLPY